MKKILSLVFAVVFCITIFASCGKDNKYVWMNYNYDEYISLADYKNIEIDASSDEYLALLDEYAKTALEEASLTKSVSVTDGAIVNGDVANINYVGKLNGVAFEGGSAENSDLTIGSGTFIDGFEEGLIGMKVGETKVLKLKFPDAYHNVEMAGKSVEFTVKINKITRTVYPEIDEEMAKKLGFSDLKEYNKVANESCVYVTIREMLLRDSKIIIMPEAEVEIMVDRAIDYYTSYAKSQGKTFAQFLSSMGMTEEKFRSTAAEDAEIAIKEYMIYYAICEKQGLVEGEKYDVYVEQLASANELTVDEFTSNYDDLDIEVTVMSTAAQEYLVANATVINAD